MNAKIKGMVFLACICMLAMAVSPVSAGTGMEFDKNTYKNAVSTASTGEASTTGNEKPVEFYNTKPVEFYQNESPEYCQNKPVEHFNTKPVEYCQNKPVEHFNTKPVEYCQNKPVEHFNTKPVEYCQNKPVSEYRMPEISEVDRSVKDDIPKNTDEFTTSNGEGNNEDLRKDAISDYLDKKWEDIKAMIIEAILSGKI
ncbi:MAG: hypothetical protein JW931_01475 [Methanomicrobiaceae archaeon]|nr:hypothetical protein [Methanomicrobiaceae archaeon]